MRRLAIVPVVLALGVAACAGLPWTSAVAPTSSSASVVVRQFRLELALTKLAWSVGEPMTGTATLTSSGATPMVLVGAGSGLITFDYAEVGGPRRMMGASTADCAPHPITADAPITSTLQKASAYDPANPSDGWIAQAMAANGVQLPAGAWNVTARAQFYEGECAGPSDYLEATVRVVVGP